MKGKGHAAKNKDGMENRLAIQWVLKNCRFAMTDEQAEKFIASNTGEVVYAILGHLEMAKKLMANRPEYQNDIDNIDLAIAGVEKLRKVYPYSEPPVKHWSEDDSKTMKTLRERDLVPKIKKLPAA